MCVCVCERDKGGKQIEMAMDVCCLYNTRQMIDNLFIFIHEDFGHSLGNYLASKSFLQPKILG